MPESSALLFDGHNDTLLRLVRCPDPVAQFQDCAGQGQLDLAMARAGGLAGGLFACFVPPGGPRDAGFALTADGYTVAMPEPPGLAEARALTDAMIACAHTLAAALPSRVALCRDGAEIRRTMARGALAMVLHLEGAEAIDADLGGLEGYYGRGVRSIGPVWSRPNRFGTGVPFRYPGTPALGPGLSAAGLALVRACGELGIMIDLSHLNAAGFWDVARISRKPLVATHSNAHAICPVPRNLLDDQLRAIRDSGGLVGISLSVSELRPDGHDAADTPLSVVLQHVEHLLGILGPDGVAIGSDLDGARLPAAIGDARGLPHLVAALVERGFAPELVRKLCRENWLSVLERSWRRD